MAGLEKPAKGVGAIISTEISATAGASVDFLIKVLDADFDYFSPDVEVTGDGDYTPAFENNGLLYGDHRLHGAMVTSQAIGISNIVSAVNPTTGEITFVLGATRKTMGKVLIRRIRLAWKRAGYFVGVSMLLRNTNNTSTWTTSNVDQSV